VLVNAPSQEIYDIGWTMIRTALVSDTIFVTDVPVGPIPCRLDYEKSMEPTKLRLQNVENSVIWADACLE
jgi:hypothetical protein